MSHHSDRPLRVAVLDEELPFPANSGKRLRTLNLLTRLARRHQITLVCPKGRDPEAERAAREYLAEREIETLVTRRPAPRPTSLRRDPLLLAALAGNLLSPWPYSATRNYSRELSLLAQSVDATRRIDVWQCEWTPLAPMLPRTAIERSVVVAHNVETQIWQRYAEHEANPLKRWYISQQRDKMQRFERAIFSRVGRVVAVSPADARLIQAEFCQREVDEVDNGVDVDYFHLAHQQRSPRELLFLGSLDWRPNQDAVRWLLGEILPRLAHQHPDVRLTIVGRHPPKWLQERAAHHPEVQLHADVPDVRPYLAQAAAMIVPLRIGGGSRLKILEALASGTPVVSTSIGAEGLELDPAGDYFVGDGAEGFAAAMLACLDDSAEASRRAQSGRATVLEKYNWDALVERLERVWYACAERAPTSERGESLPKAIAENRR